MKAAPGAVKSGSAILGREAEIAELWRKLQGRSVVFAAERRVGKTCMLRKMMEHPPVGNAVVMCWVEKSRHPSELVGALYGQANAHAVLGKRAKWLHRFRRALAQVADMRPGNWNLPTIQSAWKSLLEVLIEDIVEKSGRRVIIIFDELPHMLNNVIGDGQPALAAELLDTLRELRQHYQASGAFRFVLAGSIGLHLVVDELRKVHGYKGSPMNDLAQETVAGMHAEDVALLCRKFLDEEGIERPEPEQFSRRMREATDGLPLYIEHVCEAFQAAQRSPVAPTDIDEEVLRMLDSPALDWFQDAAGRIDTHYSRLGADRMAHEILKCICRQEGYVAEADIIAHVRSQMTVEYDDVVLGALELLRKDHYLERNATDGGRQYRFLYDIMRRWWRLNRG